MTTSHALAPEGVVELARLTRSGLVESRHLGAAAVLAPDGSVLRALGDVDALVFGRSSLKPFQALTVLRSGVELSGAQLVLATASHAGTPAHVRVVQQMLDRAGLDETALQCPPDRSLDRRSAAGAEPRRITMNCSGKHAAFLLACTVNGWSIDDYLDPAHPLQVAVRSTVEELTGAPVGHDGVDGCGAPVFATTLRALALGVGRIAAGVEPAASTLADAVLAHAWAIDGPGRANTVVIERLGLFAKLGAEGVMVMGCADGTAVALKVLDGSPRASTLAALELLVSVGAVDADAARSVLADLVAPVTGAGRVVGSFEASPAVVGGSTGASQLASVNTASRNASVSFTSPKNRRW